MFKDVCYCTNLLNNWSDLLNMQRLPIPLHHKGLQTFVQLFKNKAAVSPIVEMFIPKNNVAFVGVQLLQFSKRRYLLSYIDTNKTTFHCFPKPLKGKIFVFHYEYSYFSFWVFFTSLAVWSFSLQIFLIILIATFALVARFLHFATKPNVPCPTKDCTRYLVFAERSTSPMTTLQGILHTGNMLR